MTAAARETIGSSIAVLDGSSGAWAALWGAPSGWPASTMRGAGIGAGLGP